MADIKYSPNNFKSLKMLSNLILATKGNMTLSKTLFTKKLDLQFVKTCLFFKHKNHLLPFLTFLFVTQTSLFSYTDFLCSSEQNLLFKASLLSL